MNTTQLQKNTTLLLDKIQWLSQVLKHRLMFHFNNDTAWIELENFKPPQIDKEHSLLDRFIIDNELTFEEMAVLLLAIVPHIQPHFLDDVIQNNLGKTGEFPQLGGIRGKQFRGFIPTGETALFLVAGNNLERRFQVMNMFSEDHRFATKKALWLDDATEGEPRMCGKLVVSQEYIELFTLGKVSRPRFGMNFPAQRLETKMEWTDLVLNDQTTQQVKELEAWVKYGDVLLNDWGMSRKLKPGYRVLFHGPPGTGKTLTATLLGKHTGRDVYRIDLSMIISKYIGETEKNLSNLFDRAADKGWILFFDEADALFGKRTGVKDAHDKYANQEVSYLLQRTEDYPGLVILASNFKNNIDEAFTRRFQSFVYFPLPKVSERLELWQKAFPKNITLHENVNLSAISKKYELSGAHIMNVVQYACLQALAKNSTSIKEIDLIRGIENEFLKEGKMI